MIDGEEKLWLKSPNIEWINKYIIAIFSIVSPTRIEIRPFIYLFVKWSLSIGFLMRFGRWIKYLDNSWKKGKFPISVIFFIYFFFVLNTISLSLEFLFSWWQSKHDFEVWDSRSFDLGCYKHAFALLLVKRLVSKTLFTWSGGPRSSGVSFFCFVSSRAWKQKKPTPLDRGPPTPCKQALRRDMREWLW